MTDTVDGARRRASRLALARRAIGTVLLAAAGVAAVLFVLGTWNPWRLVFLEYRFGNPMLGLLLVPIGALAGFWLAMPLPSETRPRGRIAIRVVAAVLSVIGLFAYGLFGEHFKFDVEEAARSDDGQRRVAIVSDRDRPPERRLKVWTGSGARPPRGRRHGAGVWSGAGAVRHR